MPSPEISKMKTVSTQRFQEILQREGQVFPIHQNNLPSKLRLARPLGSVWDHLSLTEAERAPCTARHVSEHQEHRYCVRATSFCFCIPLRHLGRCLASSAAASAMTNWSWLFWQRERLVLFFFFLHGNDLSTSVHTHHVDSLSLGFWTLIKVGLTLGRHPKS